MATTPKGIYYPNDYNEIADIPEDMKKMAESIDGVFEDTDSDLSDIQEEQTTQNNRLNSLEVDNTTNKSDILTNKQDINNIKSEQTTQNNRLNNLETDNTTNKDNISANTQEINNIKQEQTEQNTNILTNATNIESLQEENDNLKKIVSQLPQVTGQGTEVSLENTIEAPFTKFDVEGNSTQETTEGYNMLDLDKYSYSESSSALNGGTVTIKDGVITLNATNATGNMTALSVTKLAAADSIEAGTYYFGVDVYGAYESTPNTNIWEYRGNRTLTEKFIIKQWKYAVTKGNIGSTPILVSNDTSKTTYEPYTGGQATPNPNYEQPILSSGDNGSITEKITNSDGTKEQTYSIPTQQPMRSIGDVRDCFVKKDGNWFERHYIARKIFDGTEEWGQNGSTASTGQYVIATTDKKYGILNLLSNSFVTKQTSTENSIAGRAINRNIYITIDLSIVEFSVAKFKAYLAEKYASGKSVYVDYELEEPLDLPCTQAQIEVLENMPSTYKEMTIINSEDETEAYLEVSGIRDIDTMFDKVTNAIISLGGNV